MTPQARIFAAGAVAILLSVAAAVKIETAMTDLAKERAAMAVE